MMSAQEICKLSLALLTIKFHVKVTILTTIIAIASRRRNLPLKLHLGLVQKIHMLNPNLYRILIQSHRFKNPMSLSILQ